MQPVECARDGFDGCYEDEYFKGTVNYSYPNGKFATSFTYIDSSIILDQSWRGKYGSYPGGGFIVELPLDYQTAMKNVSFLRNISWMDGGTRFLAMDFNTYNPSTSLHTVARIAWEMPTGGTFYYYLYLFILICSYYVYYIYYIYFNSRTNLFM